MEEQEGKSMLLIEIMDDFNDKKMPYKLKLNKETAALLSQQSMERFVN